MRPSRQGCILSSAAWEGKKNQAASGTSFLYDASYPGEALPVITIKSTQNRPSVKPGESVLPPAARRRHFSLL
jgi:hypothetical protein